MSSVTRIGRPATTTNPRATRRTRSQARAPRRYFALNGAAMVTIAGVALSIIGILYLVQTSHVAKLGYELSRLQQRRDALAIENARLGYEVAKQESLDAVAQIATEELGMIPLSRYRFLEVQAPLDQELPELPAITPEPESFWERMQRALLGVGRATAPAQGPAALPLGSGGR